MALVKTGGQSGLQKVTDETLQQRLERLSAGPTTNAAMATSAGATPDQAKMAGAGNRKEMVLKQAVQPQQTVEAAKTKAKSDAQLTPQEQAELEAAKKLAGLSGVSSKIGSIAEQRLAGAGTGVAQRQYKVSEVDKELNPVTNPTGNAAVKQALLDYANDPTKRETALATLANNGIMPERINSLLENVDTVLNRGVQTQALAGADIESAIQDLGYANLDDLAATLGRPAGSLANMTLPDIQAAIEQKRQELVTRQTAMQAKATGSGLGAQAAQQEVARFTMAGGLAQAKEAARPVIDFKAKIKIGDTEHDVETILKDEEFSNVIEQWLDAAPADRAKIIPDNWPLSTWLKNNEASLKTTEAEGAAAGKQFMEAQAKGAELKDLSESLLADVVPGYEKGKFYTDAQLTDMANKWKTSPLYGLNAKFLNTLSPQDIIAAKAMERSDLEFIANDLPGIVAGPLGQVLDTFGIAKGKALYNKNEITKIKQLKGIQDSDPTLLDQKGWAAGLPIDTLTALSTNPTLKQEVKELREDQIAFANMSQWSDEQYISNIFGGPQQAAELNSAYASLREAAQYGDAEAAKALVDLKKMDTDSDGDIDLVDAKSMAKTHQASIAAPKYDAEGKKISGMDIQEDLIKDDKYKSGGYTPYKDRVAANVKAGLSYAPGASTQHIISILKGTAPLDLSSLDSFDKFSQTLSDPVMKSKAEKIRSNLIKKETSNITKDYTSYLSAGNGATKGNIPEYSGDQLRNKLEELKIRYQSAHPAIKDKLTDTINMLQNSYNIVSGIETVLSATGVNPKSISKYEYGQRLKYINKVNSEKFGKDWASNKKFKDANTFGELPFYPWEHPNIMFDENSMTYWVNRGGKPVRIYEEDMGKLRKAYNDYKSAIGIK